MKRIFLCWVLMMVACQAKKIGDLPYAGEDGHERQKLDLYLPDKDDERKRPVFILIHGGGWSAGDKGNDRFVDPKVPWLVSAGYVVASVNYRLSPEVRHPGHVEDVRKAIGWVEKHISGHGGDPRRIYLLGHSAGAHLAALAAADQRSLREAGADPSAIKGVILLDGAGYDIPTQYGGLRKGSAMETMYRRAFTSDTEKQRDASPVHRVTGNPPPFLILHVAWRADAAGQSDLLAAALRKNGGDAKVFGIPGKTHATINGDCGKPGDPVTRAIEEFLR